MKKQFILNISRMHLIMIIMAFATITGCTKDDVSTELAPSGDGGNLNFVLKDNFNFSMAYAAINNTHLNIKLAEKGPYTVFVPNNNAFSLVGIVELPRLSTFYTNSQLTNLMGYGILNGKLELKKMPLEDNKAFKMLSGGNIYVSKYMNGADTVVTVNGVKVISADNPAANGQIQVLPQMMNPEVYATVAGYLRSDTTLTLFNAAMERSGLSNELLSAKDAYTLLALSNQALQQSAKLGLNLGLSTMDSITHADPARLAALLKYHIVKGRYFDNDLFRLSENGAKPVAMLNGGEIGIGGVPGGFKSITFTATGANGIHAQIYVPVYFSPTTINANLPCGNGVVHIINRVLIP
ncbi:fasciclin domain-containing protein [Pedobacter sp. WC2501]|uniref:fasciclin domain-containing protein n=1 Tax=Pedobacter sp. WC2501 TaxID=3461400 RepID=UPI0040454C17